MIAATALLLLAHAAAWRLRRRSAAERHVLWTTALLVAAALPAIDMLVPPWQPAWAPRIADVWPDAALQTWNDAGTADVVVRATGLEAGAWTWTGWALRLWAIGAACALLLVAMDLARLVRLATSARRVADPRLLRTAATVATAIGMPQPPALLIGRARVPITWGVARARVLLPPSALEWPRDRLETVIAHELAHVRRRDWLVHLCAEVVCAVYWFHPLFWSARNRLRHESEQAADDAVLGLGFDARGYATHLLAIVRSARAPLPRSGAVVAMAGTPRLERRLASLLSAATSRRPASRRVVAATVLATTHVALGLAAVSGHATAPEVRVRTTDLPAILGGIEWSDPIDEAPVVAHVRVRAATGQDAVTAPEVLEYTTPPLYSDEARARGVEGTVTVLTTVDPSGTPRDARVVAGLGHGLDQNALVAVRQWRFQPGTHRGTATAMVAEVDVEFSLRNEAVNQLIANDMATLVGPGVTPPRAVRTRTPAARARGRGTVVLDVVLLEDGTPRIVRILRSAGPELDDSAFRTFEQWRFTPALKEGRPVKVRMNAEVTFHG